MRDILLKFDSEEQAVTFAEENDFVSSQGKDYVYSIIGPNWINTGETETLRGESGEEWDPASVVHKPCRLIRVVPTLLCREVSGAG